MNPERRSFSTSNLGAKKRPQIDDWPFGLRLAWFTWSTNNLSMFVSLHNIPHMIDLARSLRAIACIRRPKRRFK